VTTTTSRDTAHGSRADSRATRARTAARRVWPVLAVVLGAVLWWPAGFWGVEDWWRLPLRGLEADVLALGATAAAASVSLLVRSPWPRLGIVLVFSGIGWLLSAPGSDAYPDERQSLALVLALAAFVGIVLGARGHAGPVGAALVLALVTGLSPATWPHGIPLAVALALPFSVASWHRVAPTLLRVGAVLLTWVVSTLLARALGQGWDVMHPQMGIGSRRGEVRLVADAAWDFVRNEWWTSTERLLREYAEWFWVAAALALLVAATRGVTSGARRRSPGGSSSRPGS
jgi:hypothetical protein